MTLFALLYILSIVRICQCGDDEKVVEAQPPSSPAPGDTVPEILLDVGNVDPSLYISNCCNDDGNDITFVVPRDGVLVNKVVCGETIIWSPGEGENFEYAKLYLKDGEPMVILIAKVRGNLALGRSYVRNGDVWECCTDTSQEKIHDLRVPMERTRSFIINLEEDKDTEECRIFDTKLLGIQMRLFFANPGFLATEVRDNGTPIWKAEDEEDKICLSCNLYYENSAPSLLLVVTKVEEKEDYSYFHMQNGEWKEVTAQEFYAKREGLMPFTPVTKEKEVEEHTPQRSWWTACLEMFIGTAHTTTPASLPAERDSKVEMTEMPTVPVYPKPEERQESSEDTSAKDKPM
ncbi:signal peptide-containing protein [Theileria equi strain WA]|uniref:Signal peptide-containing protein n=1 Tax=Theileria equi strain WA TaxID=1537102 RepID=L0AVX2_THEEQ|nr:signal peptide-containing protein [Theileria equi strain WA]AFZ79700.1 signal peptide-containing protein [Theileria equi strain WA]|eukprot:XP_004829366.1 signal peptide-containing protein [Theileria equi strain WA]